uniref:Chromatin modification-related protein EAF6 n=1 Tax=Tetraselmis sp. GSL018 TaxID=582737 RepID=A0A061R5I9_9CHLO|mmetsp:Transcript_41093/g.97627  ORF Transcript_41093/g.97627 Transcript_41093/m.97627 type:complete len:123 (+) Transcript_41093:113-481(+)
MSSTVLEQVLARRDFLEKELQKTEQHLYDIETNYLTSENSHCGTVLKGFDGFLSSKDNIRKRPRNFKLEDRAFSLSSTTSPATAELDQQSNEAERHDGSQGGSSRGKSTFTRHHSRSNLRNH